MWNTKRFMIHRGENGRFAKGTRHLPPKWRENRLKAIRTKEARERNRLTHIGKTLSKETKKKVSKSLLGNKRSLGYKHTEETRSKVSLSLIGNKRSLGYKHSEETKDKMSKLHLGRKHTEESKKKMSESQRGRIITKEHREKISKACLGRKFSKETKNKISVKLKEYWDNRRKENNR